jgi:hypothetical protein
MRVNVIGCTALLSGKKTKFCKEERPSCEPLTKSINSREGPTIRIFQPLGLLPEMYVW